MYFIYRSQAGKELDFFSRDWGLSISNQKMELVANIELLDSLFQMMAKSLKFGVYFLVGYSGYLILKLKITESQ